MLTCSITKDGKNFKNIENMKWIHEKEVLRELPDSINIKMWREQYPFPPRVHRELEGEWLKEVWNWEGGDMSVTLFAPAREFYVTHAYYYPNGKKLRSYQLFGNVRIGISKEFDEQGNLLNSIDDRLQFDGLKVKKEEVLKLLEAEGLFNRRTGTSIFFSDTLRDGRFYNKVMDNMHIRFIPAEGNNPPEWRILIYSAWVLDHMEIIYTINALTGEVKKEKKYAPIIM